jgi:hypothetical protein
MLRLRHCLMLQSHCREAEDADWQDNLLVAFALSLSKALL